jgi:hypothetical protein
MQCERHGLAAGPDGLCAICRREQRAFSSAVARRYDPARKIAVIVVAVLAGIVVFVLLTALLDTTDLPPTEPRETRSEG